ncbi:hypothetical protein KAM426_29450 [Aquipseudomonas alcaligenes]|nr:hypothetical protein KAM426_29450 [Pseudomonas alcaligenes]
MGQILAEVGAPFAVGQADFVGRGGQGQEQGEQQWQQAHEIFPYPEPSIATPIPSVPWRTSVDAARRVPGSLAV